MHVVIFEDSRWHAFAPFSLSRPTFALVSGMGKLLNRQLRHLRPTRLTLWVRPELEAYCRERVAPETGVPTDVNVPLDDGPALLVHGRSLFPGRLDLPTQNAAAVEGETVLAVRTVEMGLAPGDALGIPTDGLSC